MMRPEVQARINRAVLELDAWFDTMRTPDGYGGPVVHWWRDGLLFTGTGLDWRYEGIIIGYLNLYARTGGEGWLAKACRAGNDLVRGQLPTGNFRNSCFEFNPHTGGTPHEAACDLALLRLARVLREQGDRRWEQYALVAERNLRSYHIKKLWNPELSGFGDSPNNPAFTSNKSATIVEALWELWALWEDEEIIARYALPTLDTMLRHQASASGHRLDGAIDQSSLAGKQAWRFFPFYNARCIPALLKGYAYTRLPRYLEAAQRAMSFILLHRLPDGSFPQVIYGNGRMNRYPQWIAGVGDILRAMELVSEMGIDAPVGDTLAWMLNGLDRSGAIRTAHGFVCQVSQREAPQLPEFRDVLPVCGWADKAFRYLTSRIPDRSELGSAAISETRLDCLCRGQTAEYREDAMAIELWLKGKMIYRHRKGSAWAETWVPGEGIP
jgi:hypothetical protein